MQRKVGADWCIFTIRSPCNQHRQADAMLLYSSAQKTACPCQLLITQRRNSSFSVCVRAFIFIWRNASADAVAKCLFFCSGVLVAFFSARKAHTKVLFKSLALLDSQPSSFATPLQTRGKTT
jgi:hypothetical protein